MQNFECDNKVSIWLGHEMIDPKIDVLKKQCGVTSYDIDSQECIISEDRELVSISELIEQLSYSECFLDKAVSNAEEIGIIKARWVFCQFDFAYDSNRAKKAKDNPVFLGVYEYEDDEL